MPASRACGKFSSMAKGTDLGLLKTGFTSGLNSISCLQSRSNQSSCLKTSPYCSHKLSRFFCSHCRFGFDSPEIEIVLTCEENKRSSTEISSVFTAVRPSKLSSWLLLTKNVQSALGCSKKRKILNFKKWCLYMSPNMV